MVLALEPHVNFWHVQDMILVTEGAPDAAVAEVQYRRAVRGGLGAIRKQILHRIIKLR